LRAVLTLLAQVVGVSLPSLPFEDAEFPSLYSRNAGALSRFTFGFQPIGEVISVFFVSMVGAVTGPI